MISIVQIGKPAPAPSVRDMFQQLADREAEEIKRLKQAIQHASRTDP